MTCSKTHRNNRLTIRVSRDWDQVCHLILSEFSHLETSRSGDPGSEKRAQQKDWTVPSSATYLYKNIIRSIHSSFNVYILHIYIYIYIIYKCTLNTHKYLRIVRFNGIFFVVIQKTREMEGREYQWLLLVVDPKSHPPHEAKVRSFRVTPGGFVPQKTMGPTGEDLGHRRWGHIGTNIWKCREKNHFSDLWSLNEISTFWWINQYNSDLSKLKYRKSLNSVL